MVGAVAAVVVAGPVPVPRFAVARERPDRDRDGEGDGDECDCDWDWDRDWEWRRGWVDADAAGGGEVGGCGCGCDDDRDSVGPNDAAAPCPGPCLVWACWACGPSAVLGRDELFVTVLPSQNDLNIAGRRGCAQSRYSPALFKRIVKTRRGE